MRRASSPVASTLLLAVLAWAAVPSPALGAAARAAPAVKLLPIPLELPPPEFVGTKEKFKLNENQEDLPKKPRPPFLAPPGTKNVAFEKPVSASEEIPVVGDLEQITDGEKEGKGDTYAELSRGRQHVQIDLGAVHALYAIVVWHYHRQPNLCHDVVVQTADDPDFILGVRTLFNNDYDNSAGLGIGSHKEYFETCEGRLIDAKGQKARYVRLYSRGATNTDSNRYTEVEVFGIPVK